MVQNVYALTLVLSKGPKMAEHFITSNVTSQVLFFNLKCEVHPNVLCKTSYFFNYFNLLPYFKALEMSYKFTFLY